LLTFKPPNTQNTRFEKIDNKELTIHNAQQHKSQ